MKLSFFDSTERGMPELFAGMVFGLSLLYCCYKSFGSQKSGFDLSLYLSTIGLAHEDIEKYSRIDLLYAVVHGHATHIPYQNTDLYLNSKTDKGPLPLSRLALTKKLLHEKRGGMCYESSELLIDALISLGFSAKRIPTFPLNGQVFDPNVPSTHNILYVEIEQSSYLLDASYGYNGLRYPFEIKPEKEGTHEFYLHQNEKYKLTTYSDYYQLNMWIPDKNQWFSLYRFDRPIKFVSHEETVLNNFAMMAFNGLIPIRDTKLKVGKITIAGRVGYSLDAPFGVGTMFKLVTAGSKKFKKNYKSAVDLEVLRNDLEYTLGLQLPALTR